MPRPKIYPVDIYNATQPTTNGDTSKVLVDNYQDFTQGVASPSPPSFQPNSISGFNAYNSTDFPGQFFVGLTGMGAAFNGFQLAANWNAEELNPTDLFLRVNDNTGNTSTWGDWNRVHCGSTVFTTAVSTPSGGNSGDILYDTTTPKMWVNDSGSWRAVTTLYVQDQTGVWRLIKQKYQNNNGTWAKVYDNNTLQATDPDASVLASSYLYSGKRAGAAVPGDPLMLLSDDRTSTKEGVVVSNRVSIQNLVTLVSVSGIELTCSDNTPLTLQNGSMINSTEAKGYNLPVEDDNGFRWEEIVDVVDAGRGEVATIYCLDQCYAAGNIQGRWIWTHNLEMPKP